ncbi:MAG: hypothetical protein U0W40_11870 [Acidimicrobiia bacterium]
MKAFRRRIGAAGLAGALATSGLVFGALTIVEQAPAHAATSTTFSYNGSDGTDGSPQEYVVPDNVCRVTIDAYGAEAGNFDFDTAVFAPAAVGPKLGGHAQKYTRVVPGETLIVIVGGRGADGQATAGINGEAIGGAGGYNGGGTGGGTGATNIVSGSGVSLYVAAGGGGGASDVRVGAGTLDDRIVVAGGGGSSGMSLFLNPINGNGFSRDGGSGGQDGTDGAGDTAAGKGGTGSAGGAAGTADGANGSAGALGVGGNGGAHGSAQGTNPRTVFVGVGGAGGGGLYGGGGGGAADLTQFQDDLYSGGGGGGSSLGDSFETGVRSGNGEVTITPAEAGLGCPPSLQVKKVVSGPSTTGFTVHVECTTPIVAAATKVTVTGDLPYLADGTPDPGATVKGWAIVDGTWEVIGRDELLDATCTATETATGGAQTVSYACDYTEGAVIAQSAVDPGCPGAASGPSASPASVFLVGNGDSAVLTVTNTFPTPAAPPSNVAAAVAAQPRFTG